MSDKTTTKKRALSCPSCGATTHLPIFWIVGIEGIFRCKECRFPFKTGYKMGAVLSAISLSLSMLTAQLILYIFSIKLIPIAILIIIPLWITYSFQLRKAYLIQKSKRDAKRLAKQAITEELYQGQQPKQYRNEDILNLPTESDPSI